MAFVCGFRARLRPSPTAASRRRRLNRALPEAEQCEDRLLLSAIRPHPFTDLRLNGGLFEIAINGRGAVKTHKIGHGLVDVGLFGTTQDSQVTISLLATGSRTTTPHLRIHALFVPSGQLGSIQGLTTTDLEGTVSPLQGPVSALQLNSVGPAAQVDIQGNLGQLVVNQNATIGSAGHITVSNDLTGSSSILGGLTIDGGKLAIGRDVAGTLAIGGNLNVVDGGQLQVGRDIGAISAGGFKVTGNLVLASNGQIAAGRDINSFTVTGTVDRTPGGSISAGGTRKNLTVNGTQVKI
jgi:hypothetical protein